MAFPFVFSDGFENGSTVATATSGTLIDFPHYSELSRQSMAPYRGAYSARIRLAGGTTAQFIREDTAFDDLTASTTRFIRFYFYLGKDLTMADGDKFSLFEAESTLNSVTEVACGIDRSGANLRFWVNETQAAASASTFTLGTTTSALGRWTCAELKIVLDSGAGNDGTITGFIDDAAMTAVSTLDQAAIVDAKIGVIGPDAGTSGTILIDDIIYDDAQVYADRMQYREINVQQTYATDHPMIGRGRFSVGITGTGTNAVLSLYDSDGVPNRLEPFVVLRNVTANEFIPGHDIFEVTKGCYAVLSGTQAQAFFSIDRGGTIGDGAVVTLGNKNGGPRI